MTIADILSDESLRRHEFPVAAKKIFLAHAAVCPLPRRVSDAMRDYAEKATVEDQELIFSPDWFRQLRGRVARLLGAKSDEIALVGPTSLALSMVAHGFPWEAGQNILVYPEDYPSNVYPWMALAEQGVEVRHLQTAFLGRITLEDVQRHVDTRTRLVALASCHFISGYRIDIPAIGEWLRSRKIAFCLDAIQTLGVFPTPAGPVDFMAADAHKWMLGPCSAGILFVTRDQQTILRPTAQGWHNVRCPNYIAQSTLQYRQDARRYEAGTANLIGLVGLSAALTLLEELGVEAIAAELQRKRSWLVAALTTKGYVVLEPELPPSQAGAILTFYKPGEDMSALHGRLIERKIITSLRTDRQTRRYIRLSPHVYNSDEELQRFVEAV